MSVCVAQIRPQNVLVALLLALAGSLFASAMLGVRMVSPGELVAFLTGRASASINLLLLEFRLPRLLMGVLVGMGVSVSGAVLQALCRNDLAAPGLLGITAAGRLGVLAAVVLTPGLIHPMLLPFASFVGAMAVTLLVLALSIHRGQLDPIRMVLTGVAMGLALGAVGEVLRSFLSMYQFDFITAWMTGSLARASWSYVTVLAVGTLVLLPLAWRGANALNVMSLGDDAATGLGLLVQRNRLLWTALAVMLAASCAAFGCALTFLGLLGPHIARRLVGRDYRLVIPGAALVGAVLVVVADALGRVGFTQNELPAGVMVSVLGGGYFLVLLFRESR